MYKDLIEKYRPPQNVIELNKLLGYVSDLSPNVVLQVGIENGKFLTIMDELFHPELMIGVDASSEKNHSSATMITGDVLHLDTYQKVLETLGEKKVDFLFLSHDRTWAGMKKEYQMFSPLVRKGGIIAMDSIRQNSPAYNMAGIETWRVWTSIIRDNRLKYFEFWDIGNNGYGPGIGMYYQI